MIGDGNCLYRCLSRFIFGTEDLYARVRQEIYEEAVRRRNNYPDITLDSEIGPLHINQYIDHIQEDKFYGGELEINIASSLYNINIATYDDVRNNENIHIGFSFINYYNRDNSEARHLMILLNQNNIHYQVGYYQPNTQIDYNFEIPNINNNLLDEHNKNKNENLDKSVNIKSDDDFSYIYDINVLNRINSILNNLKNKTLNEILDIYKNENNKEIGYDDIYFYIYQNINNNIGKYSEKFKSLYKNNNYKSKKQIFRKKCVKYDIDENKRLIKRILITDILNKKTIHKENIVIPNKFIKDIVNTYHFINGHKCYLNLAKDIIDAGFYIKNIYSTCKNIIKDCIYCNQNRKNIFRKPCAIQIIPKGPRDVFQLDITDIPSKLQTDELAKYLLSIIDTFSKYGFNYIISNKKADTVLGKLKDFINRNGKPNTIHTDNGKEFVNKLFEEYCEVNKIKIIRGRPYHPQSQGVVEAYNKEIKRLLEMKYLENKKNFTIYNILPNVIQIYNENIHSTTKYKPNFLFNIKDDKVIKHVIDNIKKSQKKFKDNNGIKINQKCLLSEFFELKGNTIKYKKFAKKGKYSVPCTVTGNNGANEYKIILPLDFKNLKKNVEYYIDYHLIIESFTSISNKILKLFNNSN